MSRVPAVQPSSTRYPQAGQHGRIVHNTHVSSAFGRITGTRTNMREVQFGVEYLF